MLCVGMKHRHSASYWNMYAIINHFHALRVNETMKPFACKSIFYSQTTAEFR